MIKFRNYANVYKIVFTEPTKLNYMTLIKKLDDFQKANNPLSAKNGTYCVKEIKIFQKGAIILFGKDNTEASNQKRNKKSMHFSPIDLNRKIEVLTDFVHLAIGVAYTNEEKTSQVHSMLVERSSLINIYAIKDFLTFLIGDTFLFDIRKQVKKDFEDMVENSKRIIEIIKTKEIDLPILPSNDNEILENATAIQSYSLKADRGKGIPIPFFKDLKKLASEEKEDIYVRIQDKQGLYFNLDFKDSSAEYSQRYDLPLNNKTENIQEDIAEEMLKYI